MSTVFVVILGFMVLLGGIGAVSMLMPRPSRECPRCARRVRLSAPRCRNCGYQFAPDGRDRYVR